MCHIAIATVEKHLTTNDVADYKISAEFGLCLLSLFLNVACHGFSLDRGHCRFDCHGNSKKKRQSADVQSEREREITTLL